MYQRFWFVDASMIFMRGSIQEEDQSFKPIVCHNNELPIGIVKSMYKDFVLDYKTPYFLVDSLVGIDSPNNGFFFGDFSINFPFRYYHVSHAFITFGILLYDLVTFCFVRGC